jgi:hypothetical protein
MSLLTNPWFNVGMGLLANSGPSLTPVNPWRGIGQGLMAASDAKAMEAQQAYESQRMAMEQQKMAQEQQRQQMLQQWAQTQPDPTGAALFPEKAYELANTAAGEGVEIRTAGELGMTGFDPNTPVEVTMKGGRPTNYTPMTPPAAPAQPSGIQEYEFAVKQGYTGSFTDYKQQMAQAGATQVNLGGEKLPANFRWIDPADPSKGVEPIPGGPATKPTEGQGLASGFYDRMASSSETIDALEDSGYDPSTLSHAAVPDMLAPPETQQYRQAQRDWVRAKLRKESGAAIGEKEMADEIKTYFPQPNDSPKTVEQKRRARAVAERAMYRQAGPANAGSAAPSQSPGMMPPPPPGFVMENQ